MPIHPLARSLLLATLATAACAAPPSTPERGDLAPLIRGFLAAPPAGWRVLAQEDLSASPGDAQARAVLPGGLRVPYLRPGEAYTWAPEHHETAASRDHVLSGETTPEALVVLAVSPGEGATLQATLDGEPAGPPVSVPARAPAPVSLPLPPVPPGARVGIATPAGSAPVALLGISKRQHAPDRATQVAQAFLERPLTAAERARTAAIDEDLPAGLFRSQVLAALASGGAGPAAPSGEVYRIRDYFPLDAGRTWEFVDELDDDQEYSLRAEPRTSAQGVAGVALVRSDKRDEYDLMSASGPLVVLERRSDFNGLMDYSDAPLPFSQGETVRVGDRWEVTPKSYQNPVTKAPFRWTVQVRPRRSVQTPAGTFHDCLRLQFEAKEQRLGLQVCKFQVVLAKGVGMVVRAGYRVNSDGRKQRLKELLRTLPPGASGGV